MNVIKYLHYETLQQDRFPVLMHYHFTTSVESPGISIKGEYDNNPDFQTERMIISKILSMNSLFFNYTGCKFTENKIIEKTKEMKFIQNIAQNVTETYIDFPHFMSKYFD